MKYLIVLCEPLDDQYECDANRTPLCMVDDWKEYATHHIVGDCWEVYELINNHFKLIKDYDTPMEEGMAIVKCYDNGEEEVLQKYPNRTREDEVPKEFQAFIEAKQWEDIDYCLLNCGQIVLFYPDEEYILIYCEYADNHYFTC